MNEQPLYLLLYDTKNGGGAQAFKCCVKGFSSPDLTVTLCSKITRTEIGMKMHLKRVHGINQQRELFDEV